MESVVKKIGSSVFEVINNNLLLAQAFVIILFFENLFILKYSTSLFSPITNIKAVGIAPVLWFFIFIAFSKIAWAAFQFFKDLLLIRFNLFSEGEIESKVSFTAFMLVVLVSVYVFLLEHGGGQNFYPFDPNRKLIQSLYILPFLATLLTCLILTIRPCKSFN